MSTQLTKQQAKEWKKFVEWRNNEVVKVMETSCWKTLQEAEEECWNEYKNRRSVKYKFLWFEWETPSTIQLNLKLLRFVAEQQGILLSVVPKETYENFLNWMAGFYGRRNS